MTNCARFCVHVPSWSPSVGFLADLFSSIAGFCPTYSFTICTIFFLLHVNDLLNFVILQH